MSIPSPEVAFVQGMMEACPTKAVLSGVMGGGMGALFGLFMGSYDPMIAHEYDGKSAKEQFRITLRQMANKAGSYGRSFAVVGFMYSGVECTIEKTRAKHDIYNSVGAGCVTGAGLAWRAGPTAMGVGCAGFAAFSAAIDTFMGNH